MSIAGMISLTESLQPSRPKGRVWQRLRTNPAGLFGLALVLFFGVIATGVATGLMGQEWATITGEPWEPAGLKHWFGTNLLGQDIFHRTVHSVRVAFEIGLTVAFFSTMAGALTGAWSGWYADTWADSLLVFITGVLDSIPFYLFVAAVAFALKGNPWSMQIAMIATFWTTTSRLIRAEVMRLKNRDFVQVAMAMGLPTRTVLLRHVLPNTGHVLLAQAAIVFVSAIKTEVILSFLGIGVHNTVSWGIMLAESTQEILSGQFNGLLASSAALFLLLLGFNLLIDALQDAFDPRQEAA